MVEFRGRAGSSRRTTSLIAAVGLVTGLGGALAPLASAAVTSADTLRSGAASGFGRNDFGQTNPAAVGTNQLGAHAVANSSGAPLADAVSVAAGNGFVVWADHSGAVWSLGDNGSGEHGNGSTGGTATTPVQATGFGPGQPQKAVKVTAYGLAVDVLDDKGQVWQWGQVVNNSSTLAIQSTPNLVKFVDPATKQSPAAITDVSAGLQFSVATDSANRAWSWGKNSFGQLGTGTTNTSPSPTPVAGLPAVPSGAQVNLEAGRDFAVWTLSAPPTTSGGSATVSVFGWGLNDSNQQVGSACKKSTCSSPVALASYSGPTLKVLSLSGGATHTLLLTNDGVVRTWGNNGLSTYGVPTTVPDPAGLLSGSHHPYAIAAGDYASFAADTDGTLAAWGTEANPVTGGASYAGQLGRSTSGPLTQPSSITVPGVSPTTLYGVPALVTSRQGETYVIVDDEVARTPDLLGYAFGAFATSPVSGQTAPTHVVTFTNVATRPLSTTSLVLDGANPGDFSLSSSTCTGTLAVDGACSVTVTFRPVATGARAAVLVLRTSNTLAGVVEYSGVPLSGSGYASVQGLQSFRLDLASGSPTTVTGPGNVIPLANLPYSLIPDQVPNSTVAQLPKFPLPGVQLSKIQLPKFPLPGLQLSKIPLPGPQLPKFPLAGATLSKIQLPKFPLPGVQLSKIQLPKFPLKDNGGWAAVLSAYPALRNVPISSLTLADLVDPNKIVSDQGAAPPMDRVTLGDIVISRSALARVSALSVLMGGMRLDQYGGEDWCADLSAIPNTTACTDGAGLQRSMLEIDLIDAVPVDETHIGAVTVGQLRTDSQSTSANPLDDTLIGSITLTGTTLGGTHVGAIPLSAIPNLSAVVDCSQTDCTNLAGRTLADVTAALKPSASFADLGSSLNPIKLSWLVEPFLDKSSFDWEFVPKASIPLAAYPNRDVLQADVDINCLQSAGTTFGFQLPTGFRYVPGTATLTKTRGTGTVSLADPATDAVRGLVVSVPDSSFSSTGPIQCTNDSAHLSVKIGVLPTSVAGPAYRATGDVRTTALAPLTATQATAVAVTGVNRPPDDTPTGPPGAADQLIFGRVSQPGVPQYVPFDAAPGQRIEATLTGLSADLDLVLYYPQGAQPDPVLSGTATPVPFGEAPPVEGDPTHPLRTVSGAALQDIKLIAGYLPAAVAATRGTVSEELSAVARPGSSDNRHVLEVTGFNGAVSDFAVRIRVSDPTALIASCAVTPAAYTPAANLPTFYTKAPNPGVTGFGAGDGTAVLVNASRLEARFPGQSQGVLDAAYDFTHNAGGAPGQVLQVDSSSAVNAAYAAWDASPCDPLKADGVVRALTTFLSSNLRLSVKYLVLVGGDDMVPHARLADHTRDGNEVEEAADVALTGGNPIASSMAAGYVLSDDPYGTTQPISVLGQVLYVPQLNVGRLAETPADITAQLRQFLAVGGVADPRSTTSVPRNALVTDYSFLTAGGNATAASLSAPGTAVPFAVDHSLTNQQPGWTAQDLDAKWLHAPSIPSVAALNMHYDQYRALPSSGDPSQPSSLYTAQGVTAAQAASGSPLLDRRVVFTVGCHSALDIPDLWSDGSTAGQAHDFAQAYASTGLAAMVGNLGFGFGDDSTVAYSTAIQKYFADGMTSNYDLGTALSEAKRTYVSRLAQLSAYDLKSMQESVMWGLPQYRLTSGPTANPPAPAIANGTVDAISGLTTYAVKVGTAAGHLAFSKVTVTDPVSGVTSSYYTVGGQSVAVSGHPILPAQFRDVPQVPGQSAHSVVPTALTSDALLPSAQVTFARAGDDHATQQELLGTGVFPATLGHVGTVLTGSGPRNTLVVTPEQVLMDGTVPGSAQVRQFGASTWAAVYGPAGAAQAPDTITNVGATRVPAVGSAPAVTTYSVNLAEAAGRTTKEVYVLALPASGSGDWVQTQLSPDNEVAGHWSGGAAGQLGQYLVVAINDQGDAAVSTLKGEGYQPADLPAQGSELSHAHLSGGTLGANGWYTSDPTLAVDSPYGAIVDGTAVSAPYVFAGDGVHLVQLRRADGSLVDGALPVLIDTVVPTIFLSTSHASPYQLDEPVPYTTTTVFGPSGQGSVTPGGSGNLDTSKVGTSQVLTVTATSVAGLSSSVSVPYRVVYGAGSTGFLDPVLNPPGVNITGRTLVYGFSYKLVDYFGAPVTTGADTGNVLAFSDLSCPSGTQKVQLPKISGATSQPYGGSNGVWTWDIAMPDPGLNVPVCKLLTVTTNDQVTAFTADVQISP